MSGDIAVAVVDAETPGNVGTIARAMKNFGFTDLLLVDPPPLDRDGDAYGFAGQAREDVLPNHEVVPFDRLCERYYTVGFTAYPNEDPTNHVRYPIVTPGELTDELRGVDARTALVFGRERVGLSNEELGRLDRVCTIPANADYPVLNLGQAATIALYELRELGLASGGDVESQLPDHRHERAAEPEIERFHSFFGTFLGAIGHPEEKRPKAQRMMRRLVARAHPTPREISTLLGILRRATERIDTDSRAEEASSHRDRQR